MRVGKWILLLALFISVGCPERKPVPPRHVDVTHQIKVVVSDGETAVSGATVAIGVISVKTNDRGEAVIVSPELLSADLRVTADGYAPLQSVISVTAAGTHEVSLTRTRIPTVRGRIQARGRQLAYPDGQLFVWRGLTGFMLPELVVRGKTAQAESFLHAASADGFNVVRVLAMLPEGWPDGHLLSPEDGLAALPSVFKLAQAADMYVHVAVLSGTVSLPNADLGRYVEQAGAACAAAVNCVLLEVANEPFHGVHREDVQDPSVLASWAKRVPAEVLVALGSAGDDESDSHAAGDVVTVHLDRSRDPWNMVRRVRELENLSRNTGKVVINSEPDGFGEQEWAPRVDGTRYHRQTDPSLAFAFGALSRVFSVPTTFHFESGLRADPMTPNERACAVAFMEGTRIVPDTTTLEFQNTGWATSPVASARFADGPPKDNAAVRVYSGVSGSTGVSVYLGVRGDAGVVFRQPWAIVRQVEARPGIEVWEIGQ